MRSTTWMSARFSILALLLLGTAGILFALRRGGLDYDVFTQAARWVAAGEPGRLYVESPDRYLYAPGFAWIFAPFAFVAREEGLIAWSLLKLALLAYVLRPWLSLGAGLALLCLARPLLIDLQYGQVNLLLVTLAIWVANEPASRRQSVLAWFWLSVFAWAKLFALPLLLLPWLRGTRAQKGATLAGTAVVLLLPFLFTGIQGGTGLYAQWMQAIAARGIPLESHNQSFIAFLTHAFGGTSVHVIFAGPEPVAFGWAWLEATTIRQLALAASLFAAAVWLARAIRLPRGRAEFADWALLIGLLIVPLHLVWKPYFVFSLPLAIALFASWKQLSRPRRLALAAIAVNLNLSGFDVVGPELAAWLEAGALFFWLHLCLIVMLSARQARGKAQSSADPASSSPPAPAG